MSEAVVNEEDANVRLQDCLMTQGQHQCVQACWQDGRQWCRSQAAQGHLDLGRDLCHEPEIQDGQATVWRADQVACSQCVMHDESHTGHMPLTDGTQQQVNGRNSTWVWVCVEVPSLQQLLAVGYDTCEAPQAGRQAQSCESCR